MTQTKVKEHPILFSAEMVRAILDGRKVQTRRTVKNVFSETIDGTEYDCIKDGDGLPTRLDIATDNWEIAPYKVGERLWVRETFRLGRCPNDEHGMASYGDTYRLHPKSPPGSDSWCREWRTIPSIHMPRWASRITLEITDVRVQRLQNISEEDAIEEGVKPFTTTEIWKVITESGLSFEVFAKPEPEKIEEMLGEKATHIQHVPEKQFHTAKQEFSYLWQSIYGADSWNANPWVWAYTFRRITQ